MTEHPITLPPELVEQWYKEWLNCRYIGLEGYIATQAARWGADMELEACCEWLNSEDRDPPFQLDYALLLRAARRPKPLSKKERALKALSQMEDQLNAELAAEIRCALEELPDA